MNFELGPSAMCRRRQIFEDKQARFTIRVLWLLFLIVKSEVKKQIGRRWHCIDFFLRRATQRNQRHSV